MRQYLEAYRFTIITDYLAWEWLDSIESLAARIARWAVHIWWWCSVPPALRPYPTGCQSQGRFLHLDLKENNRDPDEPRQIWTTKGLLYRYLPTETRIPPTGNYVFPHPSGKGYYKKTIPPRLQDILVSGKLSYDLPDIHANLYDTASPVSGIRHLNKSRLVICSEVPDIK